MSCTNFFTFRRNGRAVPTGTSRLTLVLRTSLACACLTITPRCWAQSEGPRLVLPPATAGTHLSFQIQAEAQYLAARGNMAASMAVARRIHAQAFAQEIQNSIDYVDAYFQRRELNRLWRAKDQRDYLTGREERYEMNRRRIEKHFHDSLKGDLTDTLNWLLAELSGPTMALQYVAKEVSLSDSEPVSSKVQGYFIAGQIPLVESEPSYKLSSAEVALIRFSDGRISFSAADASVLETRWPIALRSEDMKSPRSDFESARTQVLQEIGAQSQVSVETGDRLVKALDDLMAALERAYPREQRADPQRFLRYDAARRYLRSLATEAHRVIQDGTPSLFEDTVCFQGEGVVELIQHMDRNGLVFAPPTPGGERVYRSLAGAMRNLYLMLCSDNVIISSNISVWGS